jgi:hypothetical protein
MRHHIPQVLFNKVLLVISQQRQLWPTCLTFSQYQDRCERRLLHGQ